MKVIVFGATGMVGQGVLRECLAAPDVEQVFCVGRTRSGVEDQKIVEVLVRNLFDLRLVESRLRDFDACFFCLGVSAAGMSQEEYRHLTYDLAVGTATGLKHRNPDMTFVYVSGAGTDSSEQGRSAWARVKGATENALLKLPFKAAYMLRPGAIVPLNGARSKTRSYRIFYAVLGPILKRLYKFFPSAITTTEQMGRAMLAVARKGAGKGVFDTGRINAIASSQAHP